MKNETTNTGATAPTKETVLAALRAFIAQRSGLDARNYGSRESLLGDYRPIIRHGKHARAMLRAVEWRDSITAEHLLNAARHSYSGRLSFVVKPSGAVGVDYCTGQYFPTEYRKAACALLATVLWDCWRETGISADSIRRRARVEFGPGLANTWFN